MNGNGRQLLELIEASLGDHKPLPVKLEVLPGATADVTPPGHLRYGQELSWRQAWDVLTSPVHPGIWRIVPLRGGRIVLARADMLPAHHLQAADIWQQKATGILAALEGITPPGYA